VYDLGGGTLDVSLLFVNKESVQVIATHGDDQLGGERRKKRKEKQD
jgi:molecular chaperone DnaK (HSP70)